MEIVLNKADVLTSLLYNRQGQSGFHFEIYRYPMNWFFLQFLGLINYGLVENYGFCRLLYFLRIPAIKLLQYLRLYGFAERKKTKESVIHYFGRQTVQEFVNFSSQILNVLAVDWERFFFLKQVFEWGDITWINQDSFFMNPINFVTHCSWGKHP